MTLENLKEIVAKVNEQYEACDTRFQREVQDLTVKQNVAHRLFNSTIEKYFPTEVIELLQKRHDNVDDGIIYEIDGISYSIYYSRLKKAVAITVAKGNILHDYYYNQPVKEFSDDLWKLEERKEINSICNSINEMMDVCQLLEAKYLEIYDELADMIAREFKGQADIDEIIMGSILQVDRQLIETNNKIQDNNKSYRVEVKIIEE